MTEEDVTQLAGPVEEDEQGRLILKLPLFEGGHEFVQCTAGISENDGVFLKIILPDWLVKKFGLKDGSRVAIDNAGRSFNMEVIEA